MHEIIPSADDVIAIKVADKLTSADLTSIMDRLDEIMASHEKVHVFVECYSIEGIELSGLGSYIGRAMPLMTKLSRFGRVAVVADQAWLRFATRLESAILPFIAYRVYEPDQRDEAFAWATAGTD